MQRCAPTSEHLDCCAVSALDRAALELGSAVRLHEDATLGTVTYHTALESARRAAAHFHRSAGKKAALCEDRVRPADAEAAAIIEASGSGATSDKPGLSKNAKIGLGVGAGVALLAAVSIFR